MSSDHLPIKITIHTTPTIHLPPTEKRFHLEKADWAKFQSLLINDFEPDLSKSIDDLNTDITYRILSAAHNSIPVKNTEFKFHGHPWWTPECKDAVKNKRKAYLHYKKEGSEDSFIAMKSTKQECKRVIAKAKLSYWETSVKENGGDLTSAWNNIRILKRKYNPPDKDIATTDGTFLHTPQEKAEGFVQQFSKVSSTAELPQLQRQRRLEEEKKMDLTPPSGADHPLTMSELHRTLRQIKSSRSSPGADQITYPLLKHLPPSFLSKLLKFFNKCWEEGKVPQAWKEAIVIPIPKANKSRKSISNYRPISLTSHLSKLYERLIQIRLQHFFDRNKILPKFQAGFRKGRSITDHLVRLSEHIRKAQAKKKLMLSCFFDIAKAFDTVWHAKLLQKLKDVRISANLYKFVCNFVSSRTIKVRWKGALSSCQKIDMGVPQGSVVAPMLFSFMLADIAKHLNKDTVITAYADDVALWRTTKIRRPKRPSASMKHELRVFQADVDQVIKSLEDNGFILAANKSIYMPFHTIGHSRGTFPAWHHILVNNVPILPSTSVRYLGVIFQNNGKWTQQLNQAAINGRRALNLIRAIRHETWGRRRETLVHLTKSLVRSRLLFGIQALHDLSTSQLYTLAKIECVALRLALGLPNTVPKKQVYNEAGVLPLWHQAKKNSCNYIFTSARVPNSTEEELSEDWIPPFPKNQAQNIATSVSDLCIKAGIKVQDRLHIAQQAVDASEPWTRSSPPVMDCIPGYTKQDNPHLLAVSTKELIEKDYNSDFKIFTDGSVLPDGQTGAGIYFQDTQTTFSVKLPPTTILTAELVAILAALQKLNSLDPLPPRVTIFSDSRSCLQIIQGGSCYSRPEIFEQIQDLLNNLTTKNVELQFQWVPSHVGIPGNEKADRAAKQGARQPEEDCIPLVTSISDILRKIHHAAWCLWQQEYVVSAQLAQWNTVDFSGESKDTLFANQPTHIAHLMSRIRVNQWRTVFTKIRCMCEEDFISFQHCIFECANTQDLFEDIRCSLNKVRNPLQQLATKSDTEEWTRLIQVATLLHTSPMSAYL